MRRWIGLAVLLATLAALLLTGVALTRGIIGWVTGARRGDPGGSDPMFAPTPEVVTRPPALAGNDEAGTMEEDDPSRRWVYKTLTPVSTVEPSGT